MLQIEWKSSHYHSNGRRRSRPKASTVHGWLVKWRATFSGNEHLRKEGIREMREAKAVREWKKQRQATRRVAKPRASKCFFHLWLISRKKKQRQQQTPKYVSRTTRHLSSKHPSGNIRQPTSSTHFLRYTSSNGRRPSHGHREVKGRNPHSSRKASHDSRRDTIRTTQKK